MANAPDQKREGNRGETLDLVVPSSLSGCKAVNNFAG